MYRGSVDELFGDYLFADFCSNEVFSFRWNGAGGINQFRNRTAELQPPGGFQSITGFGEDGFGELYIVQFGGGTVYKVDGPTSPSPDPEPDPTADPALLKTKLAAPDKIDGKRPRGVAKYRVKASGRTRFIVKLKKLPGAMVALAACGLNFDLNVTGNGKAKLKLDTRKGDTVPGCVADGTVQVTGVSGLDMSGTWKSKK